MSKRAFAIGAHPDDIELLMAGTLILLKQAGYEIHYMNIANGSCGSIEHNAEETAEIRRQEAIDAAKLIGAVFHESLVNDIDIFYEKSLLAPMGSIMRDVSPEILLTHSLVDYMEDHTNACRLAVTAAFCRGMPNFPVSPPRSPVNQPITVYHAQPYGNSDALGNAVLPGMYMDISSVIDQKTEILARHKSQKAWLDRSQGLDSYLNTMRDLAKEVGKMSGCYEYAEGWRRHSHFGFCKEGDDPLNRALEKAQMHVNKH